MKVKCLLSFSIILLAVIASTNLFAQANASQDSTVVSDTIRVKPNLEASTVSAQGSFAVVPNDQIGFQTYAAFSALNMLRGHAPTLALGPNAGSPSSSLTSLMVVDGLPYNNSLGGFYNLNSFEYNNIYAFRNGNAAALYGGQAANGSIFLQSKTGENVTRPTFEFNSTQALAWFGQPETTKQWLFANSLAYQQDFGMVDTRVSYTFSVQPQDNSSSEVATKFHAVKINTGFNIGSRFTARIILDHFQNPLNYNQGRFIPGQPPITEFFETKLLKKNALGNLRLQYRVLPWLSLSSQSSLARLKSEGSSDYDGAPRTEGTQDRTLVNLFVNAHHTFLSNFRVKAFLGAQYENQKLRNEAYYSNGYNKSRSERKTETLMGGAGLQYKNYLFADFDYRIDYLSAFGPNYNDAPTYAFNTSFILSEALGWNQPWLSFAKLRISLGKASLSPFQQYPDATSQSNNGAYPNSSLRPSSRFMAEYGTDLMFFNGRLGASVNYFKSREEDLIMQSFIPGTGGGTTVWVNLGTLSTNGWETIISATPIKGPDFSWQTKLIWYTNETKISFDGSSSGGGGSGIVIGNPNPDWRGSLLNQITWKGFFSSFLVDMTKGGDIITYEYDGTFPTIVLIDGTMARVRDFSVGYRISMRERSLQEIQVSVSGRNMWTIYSELDDTEGSNLSTIQKNVSLSLSMRF